jgi:hypothetical protein
MRNAIQTHAPRRSRWLLTISLQPMLSFPVWALLLALCASAFAAESKPVLAKGRTLVFVDDHDILYRSGTRRVLHPSVKHPQNPLITEDKPWELTIAWTSVYRNPTTGKYQLWYQAYAGKRAQLKTHECVVCYAESADGIHFTKPELDLHSFNEFKKSNIVLLGTGVYGDQYGNSVVVDLDVKDPQRRYKMTHYDWGHDERGRECGGLAVAFSPDGIHWTNHSTLPIYRASFGSKGVQPPLAGTDPYKETPLADGRVRKEWAIPLSMSDAADVMWDAKRKVFALYGKLWIHGPDGGLVWKHAMGRSESKDFLNWSAPQIVCTPDDADPPGLEFHTSPVFLHRGRYYCLNQILDRAGGGTMNIELMTSRDGLAWERPFRAPWFIPRSPGNQFDSGCIFSTSTFIVQGDQMRFYYGGYSSGAIGGGSNITGDDQKSGVGLATLPLDRFAGIRSELQPPTAKVKKPANVGQITLKPFDLRNTKAITINADASAGAVRAELLTEDGYRVPGFTKAESAVLRGDNLRHGAKWKKGNLAKLPRANYLLRLHLENAEVFAVTFE